ncbi:TetR family transcriptional regulator [Herpetosiphon llansteffanensis]|uniref:TetR family transcriptional regulator n=1 Tax=Herpetosiphon llansteffanensis TaxID=2094568 RepID=UPI000D7BF082|nr:TetR family transcriptional regulator [Herpetosiphon llansteffanensis]
MNTEMLTPERILNATVDVLRRYGPNKATVVDVARELGVSHGSVYRHFASKSALLDAVAERWLAEISNPLEQVLQRQEPSVAKLRAWLECLMQTKQQRARQDPQLFATYVGLVQGLREVTDQHVAHLIAQIEQLVNEGVANAEFVVDDAHATATAILHATARFHNPLFVGAWNEPSLTAEFEAIWGLLIKGLLVR